MIIILAKMEALYNIVENYWSIIKLVLVTNSGNEILRPPERLTSWPSGHPSI